MLTYDDALNLNYYKMTSFTGWMEGMRFKICMEKPKISEPAPDGAADENGQPIMVEKELPPIFHAWVWPGPYIFDLTPAEKKTDITFPFTQDGKKQIVDWINEQLTSRAEEWPKKKTDEMP